MLLFSFLVAFNRLEDDVAIRLIVIGHLFHRPGGGVMSLCALCLKCEDRIGGMTGGATADLRKGRKIELLRLYITFFLYISLS